ncbi:hypothetical protein AAGG74_16455 [Bacillus mexicanus]|uniref:hypothetical protein n=1 Tax=Bacillus mexicanus TaxID=2834415 RepID=UPI003D23FC0E
MIGYHATSMENRESILNEGFSIEKQGENESHLGNGIYLASTKTLARQYGKYLVTVEFDESKLFHLTDWIKEYREKCREVFNNGVDERGVNKVVGEYYKEFYTSQGYNGLIMDGIVGTSKEIVIYDIKSIKNIY